VALQIPNGIGFGTYHFGEKKRGLIGEFLYLYISISGVHGVRFKEVGCFCD
jgi:hypothetical protein